MLYLAASPVLSSRERERGARAREKEREKEREKGREKELEKERETETEILKSEGQSESVLYVSVCARRRATGAIQAIKSWKLKKIKKGINKPHEKSKHCLWG
jgi:hypothetical protein